MDKRTKSNYNKIEYCLGNGLELLSAPTVFAVCQDSSVFPRMVGNVRATRIKASVTWPVEDARLATLPKP